MTWPGAEVYRWRGRLHAIASLPPLDEGWCGDWSGPQLALPAGAGTLRWSSPPPRLPQPLQVRLGETGIRLLPAGDRHTRVLRDLFQQAGVPPWRRRRCPLIYNADGILLAVADLWRTAAGDTLFKALAAHPVWQPGC